MGYGRFMDAFGTFMEAGEPVSLIYPAAGEPVSLISSSWRASVPHIHGSWRANLLHLPDTAAIQRLHFLRFPTFGSANPRSRHFESALVVIPDVVFCELESYNF